jgi:SNF2 family DNA or RNA helicase
MTTTTQSPSSGQQWIPKEYQLRAIRMLLNQQSGGLFLDPGLGKTSTILATFKILKSKGYVSKLLIIAPLRPVYKVWPDEIKKWANFNELTFAILHGKDKERSLRADVDIYLINPEGLAWLFDPLNAKVRPAFDALCVDESTKFKNSQSKRFKLLKPLIPSFKRRWILTGTPSPNGVEDLFGQTYILDQGRALGRYITHFRNQYFMRSGFNLYDWTPRPGAFQEIVDKISPLVLQLSAEDYLDMPELVFRNIEVSLPPEVKAKYDEVEEHFFAELGEGVVVAGNAAAAGTKCRQIANGAVYGEDTGSGDRIWHPLHDEKLDALESFLEELSGKPCIVLYEFEHDIARICERLGEIPVLGKLSPKRFAETVDRFNRGEIPVVAGHPGSMAHGLNLQDSCHHQIWYGITWDLELYDQAIARIYRQGQTSDRVFVYHIVARGTLDETVLSRLQQKDRSQQNLLAAINEYRRQHLQGV